MAKKDKKQEESINSKIIKQAISAEVKESYLNYAMSVITARALPDVRDGLKPVHRRILYAMYKSGLTPNAKTKKSATVVGEVIGKYHPHGDAAVYDAMVVMAQDFSMRYPLVIGQGNFGSIDGDPAAAYRYTEAKLSPIAIELLKDIEKDTVDFRPNFDNTHKEPVVLPAAVPNLLLNGTLGIAVGMATNIPPHNLKELIDATVYLIDNKDATVEDLLKFVKGPDFPTGAIAFNKKDIANAYATGRGGVLVRGEAEIAEGKRGQYQIIISSLPYRVNKASLLQKIAGLVQDKKLDGIKDIRDESTDEIRIVIELKSSAHPQSVLNYIYKHTQLEETFHYNMVALVDGVPQTLSLKSILENYISHRKEVVTRRTKYDLNKAKAREHILIGLKKALDHIDEIIKLIKSSKDVPTAHANLMKKFKFSEIQATAILEMKLQKLANLERKKIEEELKQIQKLIKELEAILKSEKKLMNLIKKELQEVAQKHGDERRTKIVARGAKNFSMEDLIPDEDFALVLTKGGYVKRTNPSEYKKQKRGGVGVVDMNTKEEDVVSVFLTASAHSDLLFFTDKGKVYKIKMYEIPEAKRHTRGKAIANFLAIEQGERITSVLAMPKDLKDEKGLYLFMATKKGIVKKTEAKQFFDVRRNGLIAIKLADGDRLISAAFVRPENDIILITRKGQSIRFAENEVRAMGRSAAGVKGIILKDGDELVGAGVIEKGQDKKKALLVVSSNGYGKKTLLSEYRRQSRAGSGIKTMQITDKTKELVGASVIDKEGGELIAISKGGVVIRTDLDEIKLQGRQTQGVRIMKLKGDDELASIITLEDSVE